MSDKKYREFWIMPDHPIGYDVVKPNGESIHVIEHQAYEQMKQERDSAHALIEEMAETLTLIADKKSDTSGAHSMRAVKSAERALESFRKWKEEGK